MPFYEKNQLRYYSFDLFPQTVQQAIFTRRGGVSPAPWNSLNTGGSVGDDPARVAQNREKIFHAMARRADSIHDVWLVHGTDIIHASAPLPLAAPAPRADILFTDNPAVTLFMRFGDCVPILLHDPHKRVIGIAHGGWQGTLRGVAAAAIAGMVSQYGSHPSDVLAGVGPSIGIDHYQVGEEVASQFAEKYPQHAEQIMQRRNGGVYLDLWKANELQLRAAGVEQVQVSGLCTACHLEDWFSHRAEKGKTGRFAALMALE
ncbi:MAG: peptidoglycan editing factor PgeF [Anaerolineales bacterium]